MRLMTERSWGSVSAFRCLMEYAVSHVSIGWAGAGSLSSPLFVPKGYEEDGAHLSRVRKVLFY